MIGLRQICPRGELEVMLASYCVELNNEHLQLITYIGYI
jgi:hypothetical protein